MVGNAHQGLISREDIATLVLRWQRRGEVQLGHRARANVIILTDRVAFKRLQAALHLHIWKAIAVPDGLFCLIFITRPEQSWTLPIALGRRVATYLEEEMPITSPAEVGEKLEAAVAHLCFTFTNDRIDALADDGESLGVMVRRMQEIGSCRLEVAIEKGSQHWYVLRGDGANQILLGAGSRPEIALQAALAGGPYAPV